MSNSPKLESPSCLGNLDLSSSVANNGVHPENNGRGECFELSDTRVAPNGAKYPSFSEALSKPLPAIEKLNNCVAVSQKATGIAVTNMDDYRKVDLMPEEDEEIPNSIDRTLKDDSQRNGQDFDSGEHIISSSSKSAAFEFKENYFQPECRSSSQSSSLSGMMMSDGAGHVNQCYTCSSGEDDDDDDDDDDDTSSAMNYSDLTSVSSEITDHSPLCSCRMCCKQMDNIQRSSYQTYPDSSGEDDNSHNNEMFDAMHERRTTQQKMAESSFIDVPASNVETLQPKNNESHRPVQELAYGRSHFDQRYAPPSLVTEMSRQQTQAEVHLSVMSLPGADGGTPTEQLPASTGSLRALSHQTCTRFDEADHNQFCKECGCQKAADSGQTCIKVVSGPASDGRLPNPAQVVFHALQQSLAQDRLEKKKRSMHLALHSPAAPHGSDAGRSNSFTNIHCDERMQQQTQPQMHTLIAKSIDAMFKSGSMQIQPRAPNGVEPNLRGPPGNENNLSFGVVVRPAGVKGDASLDSPITSRSQFYTPNAPECHSQVTPISPSIAQPCASMNESLLQPGMAITSTVNGGIPSVHHSEDMRPGSANHQGFPGTEQPAANTVTGCSQEGLARTNPDTAEGFGGFDWRARRMMDVARNSIRGAAARLMMKLHLAGQKPLAPPLNDNLQYHVFFLYHHNDRDWVLSVMEKLESPSLGFKTCCHERDFDARTSLTQSTHYGIKNSLKTVIILSPDFVSDTWNHADMQLLSEMDVILIQKDLIVVLLQECDIPHILTDTSYIDANQEDWWSKMLSGLCSSDDTPMTDDTNLSLSSSLVGLNPNLQSGHLLLSIKSQCRFCGKEMVDPTEVPDDLLAHGIQITPDEYTEAMSHLMSDNKFRCHVWCYNVPAAILFFTLFLGLCLAIIPLIEARLVFHGPETGLEFVHGGIVWLCALTVYMVIIHISKRKMKENTYKKLTFVNTILIKYNLLAGVENLGLADCNKYYLHFFYFEMGPCLAYLQELMVNMEEYTTCFQNQIAESGDVAVEIDCDEEHVTTSSDRSRVLDNTTITNTTMQAQAEDLILEHSGEYINLLITKKLERPNRQRHVREAPCLCQYVEQRVYKMIV